MLYFLGLKHDSVLGVENFQMNGENIYEFKVNKRFFWV